MMRLRNTKTTGMGLELTTATEKGTATAGGERGSDNDCEMRPGGMLVQKRTDTGQTRIPLPPTIRVWVKYRSIYHELHISSQATFGELKKMLSGPTGLHHEDQKLMYKNKERDSNAFLDSSGVKEKSKLVLIEDPISVEKRYIEMKKKSNFEKTAKTIFEISLEIDKLAGKVSELESVISRGEKVVEKDIVNLIESLMNQMLKLDGINVDGDVELQRKIQSKRVQKEVEKLDMLKIKNSIPKNNGNASTTIHQSPQIIQQKQHLTLFPYEEASRLTTEQQLSINSSSYSSLGSSSGAVVITTEWETFESISTSSTLPTLSSTQPSFNWDLLL